MCEINKKKNKVIEELNAEKSRASGIGIVVVLWLELKIEGAKERARSERVVSVGKTIAGAAGEW